MNPPKNFAITGVAGYIAPRHLQAIKDTGNRLIAALDPHDSVGILDRFSEKAHYFREFERFDRHLERLRRSSSSEKIDYVSICSPNYLHDAHIRFALRIGADAICEKPLVLNPWNLDALQELEAETNKRVSTILQLRVHPSLLKLKTRIDSIKGNRKHEIILTYVTSRGPWYLYSWKGSVEQSGGLATNIGVHFFDLLIWLFGKPQYTEVHLNEATKNAGFVELENATVRWYLSIDRSDLPTEMASENKSTYRSMTVDGEEIEFSEGFTDLHTIVYRRILEGNGFGIEDARSSIDLTHKIRIAAAEQHPKGEYHNLVRRGKQ